MKRQPSIAALQAFSTVMRFGTVTSSAQHLRLAQPALSRLIVKCEEELGVPLFTRSRKRLIPNDVARQILPDVERLLATHAELPSLAAGLSTGSGSMLRIAAAPRLADGLVGATIRRLRDDGNDSRVFVDSRERSDIDRWVVSSRYDVGIASLPISTERVEVIPFAEAQSVVVLKKDDPLAANASLEINDLAGRALIMTAPGSLIRERTILAFASAGVKLNAPIESRTGALAIQMVAEGLGLSVLDQFSAIGLRNELTTRPLINGFSQPVGFLVAREAQKSTLCTRFMKAARDVAYEHGLKPPTYQNVSVS